MLLVCTLECVYALTSLGDRASEAVARVPGLVHTLVSLVTVEVSSKSFFHFCMNVFLRGKNDDIGSDQMLCPRFKV